MIARKPSVPQSPRNGTRGGPERGGCFVESHDDSGRATTCRHLATPARTHNDEILSVEGSPIRRRAGPSTRPSASSPGASCWSCATASSRRSWEIPTATTSRSSTTIV